MVRKSDIPPSPKSDSRPPERRSTIPPKAPVKLKLVKLMIGRNRRRLMSNKILPVVDPKTKEPLPFADKEYYEKFKLLAEEEKVKEKEYESLSEEERSKQPELELEGYEEDYKLWELLKDFFENATGKSIEELRNLTLENSREIDVMATKIENGIVNNMPFLDGSPHEERKNQLRELSDKANTFYGHYIKYLPEATQSLRWGTTLTNADNNVGQLALKFIASKNPRLREHSKIKLLLMLHSGFTTNHKNKGVGFEESLSFLTNFITRTVAHYDENDERGCSTTKFLKTTHTPQVKKTERFFIYDNEHEFTLEDNNRSQKIEIRKAIVTNHDGEDRVIEFVIDSRKKDDNSTTEKGLRENNASVKDHHGVKFIFNTKDDARDYEKLLIDKLQKEYSEVLILEYGKVKNREKSADQSYDDYSKQLAEITKERENDETTPEEEKRIAQLIQKIDATKTMREESIKDQERIMKMLDKKDECITIEGTIEEEKRDENGEIMKNKKGDPIMEEKKVKSTNVEEILEKLVDNIDKGKHRGGSSGSSERFKIRKYYIDYYYPDFRDEKIMPFEWQFQLYDGYVDTQVRHEVSEDEFHVNRVFEGGVMELLASPDVHPEVDLEKAKKNRIDEIRYRVEDALTHTRKGRRKLKRKRSKNNQ